MSKKVNKHGNNEVEFAPKPNLMSGVVLDVNTSHEEALLAKANLNWAMLALSTAKARSLVTDHTTQVTPIINSDEYYATISDVNKPSYRRAIAQLLKLGEDLTDLADDVERQRGERTGKLTTLAEYNQYNALNVQVAMAMSDYVSRTGPLLAAIITYGVPAEVDRILQDQSTVH